MSAGRPPAPDRSRRPPPEPTRPLRLPAFERATLRNGLTVEFARREGIPEVSVRLVLESGASAEPRDRSGLAELTSRLLTEGTADRSAVEMARWLDRLGAGYDASTGYEVGTVSMHLLSEVLEEALEFLAATVMEPVFPEREVDRVRSERKDEIEREGDEPAIVADHALIAELYGDGVYGRPVGGTRETVPEIDREAIRDFHRVRFGPEGALLLACGDVDFGRLLAAVEGPLAAWEGTSRRVETPPTPRPKGGEIILIDRPGSPQAEVRVGTIGAPYRTPDHHAIIVANAILGGLFNSRINMNLREDKGWTYGARTAFRFRRGAGPFVARTAVETAVTADAFEEILAEMERMRREPVREEELELARHALTLSLPLQFETAAQITRKVTRQRVYDLPDDYWERYRRDIEAVTPDQIREVCRSYLDPDRLTLLAVTDAEAAGPALERLGEVDSRPAP